MSEPDRSLIAEFNARRSEDAFAALVRQHVNLVFATALRQVGDAGAAEEITQNVFVALAQAAGKLGSHPTIAGWLHQTALNKSREWLRSELRRRRREQVAVNLDLAGAEGDSVWAPLVPLLDEALLELREPDRQAVILHFMEGRTFQEVGSALGVGEDAARKRVNRCLDQLTHFFRRRGFAVPSLAAGAPFFALSSHAAPAGLVASATTAGLAAAHSAASTSTVTLIKGALKIMAWTKAKTAVVVGACVLLAAGTTTTVLTRTKSFALDRYLQDPGLNDFSNAPAIVAIQSTHFAQANPKKPLPPGALLARSEGTTNGTREIGRNISLRTAVLEAYGGSFPASNGPLSYARMIFPPELNQIHVDYLVTTPDHPEEKFQAEIKRKFGWAAHVEMREADVLFLKLNHTNAPGLTVADDSSEEAWQARHSEADRIGWHNMTMPQFVEMIQGGLGSFRNLLLTKLA